MSDHASGCTHLFSYALCIMQEFVLQPINLRKRKRRNQRNEATTNHERSTVPHSLGAHSENAWCGINGIVIDRGYSADSVPLKCVFLCPMKQNFGNAPLALTNHKSLPVDHFY